MKKTITIPASGPVDPFDKNTGYAKLGGDEIMGFIHMANGSCFSEFHIGKDTERTIKRHSKKVLINVIEWWYKNSHQEVARCLIAARGGGPYEEEKVDKLDWLDEKFVSEQLRSNKEFGYASINGSAMMMLLTMANGVFHCDLGFSNRVKPEQRAMAKQVLLDIVDWWHDTLPKELERCQRAHNEWLNEKFFGKNLR